MSRKKRKIATTKTNKVEFSLTEFRVKVLGLLKKCIGFRVYFFNIFVRKGVKLKDAFLKGDFRYLSDEDKLKRIMHYKDDRERRDEFVQVLKASNYGEIKKIFRETFPSYSGRIPSKEHIAKSLISKFYEEEPEIFKRKDEEGNLKSVSTQDLRDLQSVEFGNVYVPVDIIILILSFLVYDSKLLTTTGCVCKGFYLTILSTWPRVTVSESNLYQISLLVLQNVREVTLYQRDSKSNFIMREMNYLLTHLSQNRLRTTRFTGSLASIDKTILFLEKYLSKKKKPINPFENVTDIEIDPRTKGEIGAYGDHSYSTQLCNRIQVYDWKATNLNNVFPNLSHFKNPVVLEPLKGLVCLRKLSLNIIPFQKMGYTIDKLFYFLSKASKSIRELHFCEVVSYYPSSERHLPNLVSEFTNLEKIHFSPSYNSRILPNYSFLEGKVPKLKEFVIDEQKNNQSRSWPRLGQIKATCSTVLFATGSEIHFPFLKRVSLRVPYYLSPDCFRSLLIDHKNIKHLEISSNVYGELEENPRTSIFDNIFLQMSVSSHIPHIHFEFKIVDKSKDTTSDSLLVVERKGMDSSTGVRIQKFSMGFFCICRDSVKLYEETEIEKKRKKKKSTIFKEKIVPKIHQLLPSSTDTDSTIIYFSLFVREYEMNEVLDWNELDEIVVNKLNYQKEEGLVEFFPGNLMVNRRKVDEKVYLGYYDTEDERHTRKLIVKRKFVRQIYEFLAGQ